MLKKNSLKLITVFVLLSLVLVACGDKTAKEEEAPANPMNYVATDAVKEAMESDSGEYILLDLRKNEDFNTSHLKGAFDADLDAAKEGDNESGIANLKSALKAATGSETGNDGDKYALICYSGKSYAQKGTDLLLEMGIPADRIFTLEGGMKAWEEAGEDYTNLLEK